MNKIKNALGTLRLKNMLGLTVAGIINAFGITMFLNPVHLYDTGVSGTAMLLAQVTPLSLPVFLILINIPLFLYGWRKQGTTFTIYAIYVVAVYAAGAWLITDVLPIDVEFVSPFAESDLLLCALFGGMISGVGSGLSIRFGGAMDGIETLAIIFAKRMGLTVGTFVMVYNVILYIICGIVIKSWILPLYSIVTYMAALKTIDFIVEGIDRSKAAYIITTKPKEICKELSDTFACGITTLPARGFYSDEEKTMIYIVVNRFQIGKMKDIVHEIDNKAYVSICEIAEAYSANQ